jgi:MATE family multidrug resistance protein
LQFFFIFSYLIDGFAYAAEALVGKFVGAQNRKNFLTTIRYLFIWGTVISLIFTLFYALGGNWILSMLTNNAEIISAASPYLKWLILLPILSFASFLYDGIYIGATASVYMRKTMMAATLFIFIPVYFGLKGILFNHGLWIAMLSFMLARGIFQAIYFKKAILVKFK